eukprot:Nk52_evm8s1485 gene=Nk52_evmTU8s1485
MVQRKFHPGWSVRLLSLAHSNGFSSVLRDACAVPDLKRQFQADLVLGIPWLDLHGVRIVYGDTRYIEFPEETKVEPIKVPRKFTRAFDVAVKLAERRALQKSLGLPAREVKKCDLFLVQFEAKPTTTVLTTEVSECNASDAVEEPSTADDVAEESVPPESPDDVDDDDDEFDVKFDTLLQTLPGHLHSLFKDNVDSFRDPTGMPPERDIEFRIDLISDEIPKKRLYKLTVEQEKELKSQLDTMLKKGLIKLLSSPFGAAVLFAAKKNGKLRICTDFRALNNITVKNTFPLPLIDDALQVRFRGCKYFTCVDFTAEIE